MAYIGKDLPGILNHNKLFETFTGDGIITSKVLSRTPGSVNNVDVFYDGAFQTPGVDFTLSGNTITFTSAPPNGVVVSILAGEDSQVITPEENTVTSTKIANNTITNSLLPSTIPSTKLSGSALPAIDGSNLQNVSTGLLSGSSDPTITQNPASGLGTVYTNTTDGEVFVLTDATTNKNVWVNVGGGFGDVGKAFGGLGGGTVNGWMMGSAQSTDVIQNYSYSTDDHANDIANLSSSSNQGTGNSSATHGYKTGGHDGSQTTLIQKFAFVNTAATAATAGNLQTGMSGGACSIGNKTHAYTAGGHGASSTIRDIQKFSYDSEGTANKVSDLTNTNGNYHQAGSASVTHGYSAGGEYPGTFVSLIDRFSFANEASISNIGDLTAVTGYTTGESSDTHGYASGGMLTSPFSNATDNIQKYSFASDSVSSADIGSITQPRIKGSSSSSQTRGYHAGGDTGSGRTDTIDRFDFANESQTADVGNLLAAVSSGAGAQY